ncbi:hypothetical protein [Actinomadura sp. 9N407]|uniref:hypothetical protein n=1 Tax=Actinomadura sp. 9N407 TaxID=3375154 RepID=UPI003799A42D
MFHNDIMYAVMQERARDMRVSAKRARDAGIARRGLRFWADEAAKRTSARTVRRATRAGGTAAAAGR